MKKKKKVQNGHNFLFIYFLCLLTLTADAISRLWLVARQVNILTCVPAASAKRNQPQYIVLGSSQPVAPQDWYLSARVIVYSILLRVLHFFAQQQAALISFHSR